MKTATTRKVPAGARRRLIHIITCHMPYMRRQAHRLVRDHFEADDLVQDTMERALNSLHICNHENVRGWLNVILVRMYLNHRRQARRKHDTVPLFESYDHIFADNLAESYVLHREINEALQLLPKYDRVITERAFRGYTDGEISRDFGMTKRTAKNKVYRNKLILRRRLNVYKNND